MARTPLYSPSPQRPRRTAAAPVEMASAVVEPAAHAATRPQRWARAAQRHERWAWALAALLLAMLVAWPSLTARHAQALSIEQIDAALRESIAKEPLPSAAAAAYEAVLPSVVRVVGLHGKAALEAASAPASAASGSAQAAPSPPQAKASPGAMPKRHQHAAPDDEDGPADGRSVGTGVVIVDKGVILTNLHVVAGADRIIVSFFDGTESEAIVIGRQPQDDLAVLQAKTIPDDLHAATLRSTSGLAPGDHVLAVGFPFGIGPSASAGVVSGLKREFRSPQGQRQLTNLIQFDAAANPGNSGGPLVTMDGNVVGIVTAIMNPNQQRTFIGIGFAVPIENAASAVGMPPF
ncbi:MAG: trypsin-like peptidase domain-containing protein [Ideonella sp.]|nr:trypsin-like peptidase domain-containing protein [Ideonella sp.]